MRLGRGVCEVKALKPWDLRDLEAREACSA